MAKKSKYNNLKMILILSAIIFLFVVLMVGNSKKEQFKNIKENFEEMRSSNSCSTCKVRNQG